MISPRFERTLGIHQLPPLLEKGCQGGQNGRPSRSSMDNRGVFKEILLKLEQEVWFEKREESEERDAWKKSLHLGEVQRNSKRNGSEILKIKFP
jgi:hypothetical protein